MKVGIFGGSFDPVHNEHIAIAESAVKELGLDKLFIMPTFSAPHKSQNQTPAIDRLNMLKLAFSGKEKIEVSDYEINNGGKSYSYITAEHFSKLYDRVYMIIGGDMLKDFKTWRYPEKIVNAVDIAVFNREDFTVDYQKEREYFIQNYKKDFYKLSYNGKNQSSTKIRVYSSLDLDISCMTAKLVAEYIKEKGLYRGGKIEEGVISSLPIKRRTHTANVVITALKKVKELNLDSNKVRVATLLHDIAKYRDYKDYPKFTLPNGVPEPVIHAFLGGYIAKTEFGVDNEIEDAISYHTSGKANMSTLGKLVFVADMIEEGRDYEGVNKLRELYEKDFNECFIECLKEEMVHLTNKKTLIYEETVNAYNYYVNRK